jgi:hypothetical protein
VLVDDTPASISELKRRAKLMKRSGAKAKGSKFSSWEAAWRNWLLNELKFHPQTNAPVNGGRTLEDILS